MSTTLTANQIADVERQVLAYLDEHGTINNRTLRGIVGVNYDQAIFFFNMMIEKGVLQRTGVASGTRYILACNQE